MTDTVIQIVKLTSGEELLAEIVAQDEDGISIQNPLIVIPQPPRNQNEPMGFAFMPWGALKAEDATFDIKAQHVIYVVDAQDEVVQRHRQTFSRIQAPPPGLVADVSRRRN